MIVLCKMKIIKGEISKIKTKIIYDKTVTSTVRCNSNTNNDRSLKDGNNQRGNIENENKNK